LKTWTVIVERMDSTLKYGMMKEKWPRERMRESHHTLLHYSQEQSASAEFHGWVKEGPNQVRLERWAATWDSEE
jgi:hypothetical protein